MNEDVSYMDDAATFERASRAAMAGVKWLSKNVPGWSPTRPDFPIMLGHLFGVTRSWLRKPQKEIYRQRLAALDLSIEEIGRCLAAVRENGDTKSLPGGVGHLPHGKNASDWESQCRSALETLSIVRKQTKLLLIVETRFDKTARISSEITNYKMLFEIYAHFCGKETEEIPLSATEGPRTHAMNFILSVVKELEDKPPSLDTIRRRIKN